MRYRPEKIAVCLTFMLALVAASLASAHPIVAGFERFYTDGKADAAAGGRLLLGELNCTSCHTTADAAALGIMPKRAPLLGDIGARVKPQWLRDWLTDPHKVKPGTTMPHVLASRSDAERAAIVEALVHYLSSLQGDKPVPVLMGEKGDGTKLFNTVGCAACHAPLGADAAKLTNDKAIIPLPDLHAKYQSASALAAFLIDTPRWRPSARMPKMNLSADDAVAVAAAFGLPVGGRRIGTRGADDDAIRQAGLAAALEPGLTYEIYEGQWTKLPEFDAMKSKEAGVIGTFDVAKANGKDNIGFRFRGYLEVPADGVYTFFTMSDDGSRLVIGRDLVVDNDNVHAPATKSGTIELKKGLHAITVEWFEAGGGEELNVAWDGPTFKKQTIPGKALRHLKGGKFIVGPDAKPEDAFLPEPAMIEKGRKLFTEVGCASCHQLKEGDKPAEPLLAPKVLASLKGAGDSGCLSDKPTGLTPFFALSSAERAAIKAALASIDQPVKLTAAQVADQTMTAFNCYACHVRQNKGGPEDGRDPYFISTGDDLGDEGRLPPHLSDVGVKLTPDWLRTMLDKGDKVRPYMATHMPAFGLANVGQLVEAFAKADGPAPTPQTAAMDHKVAVQAGRALTGKDGMSCISCHRYNGQKSLGLQAMDLTDMPKRLQRDWFNRYLLNPVQLRPGTRMPQFWPEGKSVRTDILGGNTSQQVESLWQYLHEGPKAGTPRGLNPNEILLTATNGEALIYRNFIQDAGARAIAVAYPELVNIAWDANEMRLALIWQGDFIDASKHWVGRGPGFQGPYGTHVVHMADGPPLAMLSDDEATWPNETGKKAGYEFVGYQLDSKRRPTLMFAFNGVDVTDYFEGRAAAANGSPSRSLHRVLTLTSKAPANNLYFRVAASGAIEAQNDGTFKLDTGPVLVKIQAGATPIVRKSGNKDELLVPVSFKDGKASISMDYVW